MPSSSHARGTSVSTTSSLLQDVPGAFESAWTADPDDVTDEGNINPPAYQSLSSAVFARRAEYVRPKHVRIKVGTWNVAAYKGTLKDIGGWFVEGRGVEESLAGLDVGDNSEERESVDAQESKFGRNQGTIPSHDDGVLPGSDQVGMFVLGLQEIVDLGSAMEALRPYTDPSVANKWKEAMMEALPAGYQLVAEQQLIGLLLLVYAAPDVAADIKSVSTTSVGTGLMNVMGNKGAVTARIVLGETTRLVFINSHLAAGSDRTALERRNWDSSQIVSRTRFEPIQDAMDLAQTTGEMIGDEDFAFWFGDLNYRLEGIPGEDIRRLLMLHTRNEYDLSQLSAHKIESEIRRATSAIKERISSSSGENSVSSSPGSSNRFSADTRRSTDSTQPSTIMDIIEESDDPTSLQTTLASLLPHDELHQQMKARKAFHDGWREGPIKFLPTYKYDAGSVGLFDSSEKKRAPSWCDRILYRTRKDKMNYEAKVREEEAARKMDDEMKANGTDMAGNDEEILYDYDPDTDGADASYDEYDEYEDADDNVVVTRQGFEDEMELEYYTAHQRVLSSDHKPLDAIFALKYDAIVPELKAKVHAEVAKELDKAENEGRPNVTVVVDKHHGSWQDSAKTCPADEFDGVWFGDLRWAQTKHRGLTIANTSRVPASFSFIERPVDANQSAGIAPKWLKIKVNDQELSSSSMASQHFTLQPGETCSADLEVSVSLLDEVRGFNDGSNALEDILVLRVEHGRDHFIPVRGHWLESSLGRSIDKLIRIPEGGIRKMQQQRPQGKKGHTTRRSHGSVSSKSSSKSSSRVEEDGDEPVRSSAPRELFRLTQAIEELAVRVIAEWEMTNPLSTTGRPATDRLGDDARQPPPWQDHLTWPFDETAWTERKTSHWTDAMSEACNALDEDQMIEPSLPADLPHVQQLYVLADLLMQLLASMPDGIVSPDLWHEIEIYLNSLEKNSKRSIVVDEQRTAIQEILAKKPPHSISFILIIEMIARIVVEMSTAVEHGEDGHTMQLSPTQKLRRIATFGKASGDAKPARDRKQLTIRAMAQRFADVIIRSPSAGGEKARSAAEKKKTDVLEMFLKKDDS